MKNGTVINEAQHASAAYGYLNAGDADAGAATFIAYLHRAGLVPATVTAPELEIYSSPFVPGQDDRSVKVAWGIGADIRWFVVDALRADGTRRCPKCGHPEPDAQCFYCGEWQEQASYTHGHGVGPEHGAGHVDRYIAGDRK